MDLAYIEFSSTASMHEAYDPDSYVSEFKGRIIAFDEHINEVEAGVINGKVFKASAVIDDNFSMLDAIDSSSTLREMVLHIWDKETEEFNPNMSIDDCVNDIVIIDEVIVSQTCRGNNIALSAIQNTVRHWVSGYEWIVMLKASPLQHCLLIDSSIIERYELNGFNKDDEEKATSKLLTHYGKIGFECIDDTNFMYVSGALKSKFKM